MRQQGAHDTSWTHLPAMPPCLSPDRPLKRSRTLPDELGADDNGEGVEVRSGDVGAAAGAGPSTSGRSAVAAAAAAGLAQPSASGQPSQQNPSQQQPQPSQQEAVPSQQQQLQQQSQQQQQPQPSAPLASGATSVALTAPPQWAEEALRGVDPFWQPKETLAIIPTQQAGPAPGTHGQLQSASALFTVAPSALAAIKDKKAQARLVCVQPFDGPPNRCHWYGGSYVLLNQQPYDVTKEDRVQLLLGPNQADQAADLSPGLVRGANRLTLLWPFGVAGAVAALRLCEPLAPGDLAARLAPPLPLREAVELVQRHMGGGVDLGGAGGGGGEGSGTPGQEGKDQAAEEEEEAAAAAIVGEGGGGEPGEAVAAAGDGGGCEALVSGPVSLSLRCPLHGGLAAAPAHFGALAAASPLAFFDVTPFLELARRTGSWVCPATGRLGGLQDLRPHAFLTAVLRTLDHNGVRSRVEAIEVAPCGGWRPKGSRVPFLSALEADPRDGGQPPSFDPRLLEREEGGEEGRDVVDLTDD